MINPGRADRRDLQCMRRCSGRHITDKEAKKLIRELQLLDFSLIDTILYLDAYPCSSEALEHYHKLLTEKKKVEELLEQSGYPITAKNNISTSVWEWTDGPWPWELEANM